MASGRLFQLALGRCYRSPVLWMWAFNGLRVASGLLLLPLLLRALPDAELGMYYIFLRITALLPIIDFGFSATVARFVGYAAAGATELKAHGFVPSARESPPNHALLWRLLFTYQKLYRLLAAAAFVLLGIWGTWNVALNVHATASPLRTWMAWAIALLAATLEIYAGWWNVFLRGMNEVLLGARFAVLGYLVQLLLGCLLLVFGGGLLSVPLASLAGSLLQRFFSRKICLKTLGGSPLSAEERSEFPLLRLLWPNSWRIGLQFLSGYLGSSVPALIFAASYGSAVFAQYGLSSQLVSICASMASVWTLVRWPLVSQLQARQDQEGLCRLLRPAAWLQTLTYLALAGAVLLAGPWLLQRFGSHKQMVPPVWFAFLALSGFLDLRFSFWTTLLSTENRIPSLWPTAATNAVVLLVFVALWRFDYLNLGVLILVPLAAGALFNYWYWPIAGARSLRTTWRQFAFGRAARA